mgnify:CR=1 FL=1
MESPDLPVTPPHNLLTTEIMATKVSYEILPTPPQSGERASPEALQTGHVESPSKAGTPQTARQKPAKTITFSLTPTSISTLTDSGTSRISTLDHGHSPTVSQSSTSDEFKSDCPLSNNNSNTPERPVKGKIGRPRKAELQNLQKEGEQSPSEMKCLVCKRVFPRIKSLEAHMRIHTGNHRVL